MVKTQEDIAPVQHTRPLISSFHTAAPWSIRVLTY
jgi:hypothetical protein